MLPVLFNIPVSYLNSDWADIPVHGYGVMLFLAFVFCVMLARRLCRREGIDGDLMPDLAISLFITGILGGRLVYVIQYWDRFPDYYWNSLGDNFLMRLIALWDGGLVLYGALFGAAFGFFGYYLRVLRKHNVSIWKMLDVTAPCIALGIALGRIGCLCTGCCYGNVAGDSCPSPLHFPLASPPTPEMIYRGHQTPFGFLFAEGSLRVVAVEPGSSAAEVLRPNDDIVEVNGKPAFQQQHVVPANGVFTLKVFRDGELVTLPPFEPRSIGLTPTQPFETISMCLLLFFLLSYYPYKRRDGELMVLLMVGYGVHRFLNEMLRTDTTPVAFGLTLSQNISIGILSAAVILALAVWRRPLIAYRPPEEQSEPAGSPPVTL